MPPARQNQNLIAPPRARGRPSKRHTKRLAMLDDATALFNARGISGVTLADVAETLGLARASLYYYVNDRAELVFQCYMRACELTAENLAAAGEAETGLERTLDFIRRALSPDCPASAVLSEINSLDGSHAQIVVRAHERNVATLTGFIGQGMEDGSIRPCDNEIAAQAIIGMLAWAQLLPQWTRSRQMQRLRMRTCQVMTDLLTAGLAVDRAATFECRIDAEGYQPRLVNAFDRRASSQVKVAQLLATASRLFNRYGIEATSFDQIAAVLGVTKGVLYHYFDDKSELVTSCYERAFDLYGQFVEAAETQGRDGLDAALINAHLNVQAQVGSLSPLMPQPGFEAVPEAKRAALIRRGGLQNEMISSMLERGVREGVARPCGAAMVTHICAGAFGWLPKWLEPQDERTSFQVADEVCTLLLRGLGA
jgi:AcrR family transcriptional regulator